MNIENRLNAALNLLSQIEQVFHLFRVREETLNYGEVIPGYNELPLIFHSIIRRFFITNQIMSDDDLQQIIEELPEQWGVEVSNHRSYPRAEELLRISLKLFEELEILLRVFSDDIQHRLVMMIIIQDFFLQLHKMKSRKVNKIILMNMDHLKNSFLLPK